MHKGSFEQYTNKAAIENNKDNNSKPALSNLINGNNENTSKNADEASLESLHRPEKHKRNEEEEKYWQMPMKSIVRNHDMVVIHVCDENQQISKDFCCKREILVNSMKYFEKFLSESEGGYDDIDISVHCDAEIFEWLMTYIHEKDINPPKIDKSIIVSILISSDFLQMDALVEQCIQHIAVNLNDIVKLPIDLSCISEKLVNRIAYLVSPKSLTETRDRKDKVLTKLYKRRVELDFSRRGSVSKASHNANGESAGPPTYIKTIAASLTCCRNCSIVYLENYSGALHCNRALPTVDFRGNMTQQHCSIPGWSLTAYLKALHAGGMAWDAIYWHVWAACVVLKVPEAVPPVMISVLETDRYCIELDGLMIFERPVCATNTSSSYGGGDSSSTNSSSSGGVGGPKKQVEFVPAAPSSLLPPRVPPSSPEGWQEGMFTLGLESAHKYEDKHTAASAATASAVVVPGGSAASSVAGSSENRMFKLKISELQEEFKNIHPNVTSTLNPSRPPEILTREIYDLACSQLKHIAGSASQAVIHKIAEALLHDVAVAGLGSKGIENRSKQNGLAEDYYDMIWGSGNDDLGGNLNVIDRARDEDEERGRGRSKTQQNGKYAPTTAVQYNTFPKKAPAPVVAGADKGGDKLADPAADSDDSQDSDPPARRPPLASGAPRRSKSSDAGVAVSSRRSSSVPAANSTSFKAATAPVEQSKMVRKILAAQIKRKQLMSDPTRAAQIAILKGIPPEVLKSTSKPGHLMYGIWLAPSHPLQLSSRVHTDSLRVVDESGIGQSKRLEWELDILREWDEKKITRLQRFLLSKRSEDCMSYKYRMPSKSTNAQAAGGVGRGSQGVLQGSKRGGESTAKEGGRSKIVPVGAYYKDKGRQPK